MTLRVFETADAKYYLGLGIHDASSAPIFEHVDFKGIDFIVWESGLFSPEEIKELPYHTQYEELYNTHFHPGL